MHFKTEKLFDLKHGNNNLVSKWIISDEAYQYHMHSEENLFKKLLVIQQMNIPNMHREGKLDRTINTIFVLILL